MSATVAEITTAEPGFQVSRSLDSLSAQLNRTCHELEHRIGELQHELAQTDRERKREHKAKERLAGRLDLILEVMPVAIILLDGRGLVAQANSRAEDILGGELRGRRWIDVIRERFAPTLTDGHEVALKDGRLLSLATQSLGDEPGQIIVLTDQTETRRLQEKLNHHRKLSEMGRMTASLAHQIRTPLSAALLYADHLVTPSLPEDRRLKYAARIRDRLQQLGQQVQDMLIFSRGGVVLDQTLAADALLNRFQQQLDDLCEQQQATAVVEVDAVVGQIRCNPELLTSAFGNLLENAVQACQGSGIRPLLQLSAHINDKGLLEIVLSDNGPGIPTEAQQKILEPFFTTKSTGTGLGLPVVNAIIEGHGGCFQLTGTEGACARIRLPLLQAH